MQQRERLIHRKVRRLCPVKAAQLAVCSSGRGGKSGEILTRDTVQQFSHDYVSQQNTLKHMWHMCLGLGHHSPWRWPRTKTCSRGRGWCKGPAGTHANVGVVTKRAWTALRSPAGSHRRAGGQRGHKTLNYTGHRGCRWKREVTSNKTTKKKK